MIEGPYESKGDSVGMMKSPLVKELCLGACRDQLWSGFAPKLRFQIKGLLSLFEGPKGRNNKRISHARNPVV